MKAKQCSACGAPLEIKLARNGHRFYACPTRTCRDNAGKCRLEPFTIEPPCPKCGGPLSERSSRFGVFYACDAYPACKFAFPAPLVNKPCPHCNYPAMREKTTKRRGREYVCVRPECQHSESVLALASVLPLAVQAAKFK